MSRRVLDGSGPWTVEDRVFEEDGFFLRDPSGRYAAKVFTDDRGGAAEALSRRAAAEALSRRIVEALNAAEAEMAARDYDQENVRKAVALLARARPDFAGLSLAEAVERLLAERGAMLSPLREVLAEMRVGIVECYEGDESRLRQIEARLAALVGSAT